MNRNRYLGGIGVAAVALALGVSGCGQGNNAAGSPGASAAEFANCLKSAGARAEHDRVRSLVFVQSKLGPVWESDPPKTDEEMGIPPGSSIVMGRDNGRGDKWVAVSDARFFEKLDPELFQAYANCEAQYPGFRQSSSDPRSDPQVRRQFDERREASLTFAQCGRDAGFSWATDPVEPSDSIALPDTLPESEFRELLAACFLKDDAPVSFRASSRLGFDVPAVLLDVLGPGHQVSFSKTA